MYDNEVKRRQQARWDEQQKNLVREVADRKVSEDLARQMPRRWRVGDVYAPHDLSPEEMGKWRRQTRPAEDVLDVLGLNPLDEYRVCRLSISTSCFPLFFLPEGFLCFSLPEARKRGGGCRDVAGARANRGSFCCKTRISPSSPSS